jgi:uncharacterized repeat protein (TIGR01451 family)
VLAGQAVTFTFVVTHTGAYGQVVVNTAVYSQAYSEGGTAEATFDVLGPPQVSLSPASLDFGRQLVGIPSTAKTVTLTNAGAAALNLAGINASGDFAIQANTCARSSLSGGASCSLSLTFTPVITGQRTGNLTIASNAASSPDSVSLTGVGVAPLLMMGQQVMPEVNVAYHGVVTYAVVLANLGTADAGEVVLTDTLPSSTTFARWVDNPSGVKLDNDQLSWQGTVTAGQFISFTFMATHTGVYGEQVTNWVSYYHSSGSGSAQATFSVEPNPIQSIYLPIIIKNWPGRPDLTVASLTATGQGVTVVIQNSGDGPVTDSFWVDVYLNPDPPPSHVNQVWWQLCDQGLVWGVTAPMLPQGVITLTFDDAFYRPDMSGFSGSIAPGTLVYAQVDSVNLLTTYGGVLESNEQNNIAGPVVATAVAYRCDPGPCD